MGINYEIICVDNGSTDVTPEFFKENRMLCIENAQNLGVAKAWNQGIKHAKGRYSCIINNDIIVTKNWLDSLLRFVYKLRRPGIISPGTREGALDYEVEAYAAQYTGKMKKVKQKGFCGWCMMINTDRFMEIGLFDEGFGIGIGEDTDYYYRLKHAGYESWITGSAFIHHFGSATIKDIKSSALEDFENENIKKLNEKWGIKTQPYVIRKVENFKRFLNYSTLKAFKGHTLIEK